MRRHRSLRGASTAGLLRAAARYPGLAATIRRALSSWYNRELKSGELASAACLAYLRAVQTYRPGAAPISVYASYFSRAYLARDLAAARSVLPSHAIRLAQHLRYLDHDDELAQWLAPEEYDDDLHASIDPAALPDELLARTEIHALVESAPLTQRQREIVRRRWLVEPGATLEELGRKYSRTREAIRLDERRALAVLRREAESRWISPNWEFGKKTPCV